MSHLANDFALTLEVFTAAAEVVSVPAAAGAAAAFAVGAFVRRRLR